MREVAILFLLIAIYSTNHDVQAYSSTGSVGTITSPLCQITDSECELQEDLVPGFCTEPAGIVRKRPPHNADTPFDQNYVNLYTPMPDGGLVLSADRMEADLRITSPDQSFGQFQSRNRFIFGYYSMYIKVIPKDSAGVVATYYFSSPETQPKASDRHDEIDFEFLGNTSGNPIILQTNVFVNGQGNKEQHHYLPFDPRNNFHKYSVLWNQHLIIWSVDDKPIRVFHNKSQEINVAYPVSRPMAIQCSIWDGSEWATQGGRVKINYTNAPFVTQYQGFGGVDGCSPCPAVPGTACDNVDVSFCSSDQSSSSKFWYLAQQKLTGSQIKHLKKHRSKYIVYDYCTDTRRFPQGLPLECPYNY